MNRSADQPAGQPLATQLPEARPEWLCLDLFDTLLARRVHPEDVKRLVCERLSRILPLGLDGGALYARRAALERRLCEANQARGLDLEFSLPEALRALWEALPPGAGVSQAQFLAWGEALEVTTECALTIPDPEGLALLQQARQEGLPCCLVSDFYMPAPWLRQLLGFHDLERHFHHVIVSADTGLTKRSGRQWPGVIAALQAPPAQLVMVGDNAEADFENARAHGLQAVHLDRRARQADYAAWSRAARAPRAGAALIAEALAPTEGSVFPELALSLFCFTEALADRLLRDGVRDVFFLAREGQLLKRLFDAYQARRYPQAPFAIRSHYLEASRRATFLPSLGPLEHETFETLFRQYRRISPLEFLQSLGLEAEWPDWGDPPGLDWTRREADFPSSEAWARLRALPAFQAAYARARAASQAGLSAYLAGFARQQADERLVLVDVGWKGTIQDHLSRFLAQAPELGFRQVTGYYLGLVAPGAAGPGNEKHGLLFDLNQGSAPQAAVFNENRALFEVALGADHGAASGYARGEDGRGLVRRSPFEEAALYQQRVAPLQAQLVSRFNRLDEDLQRQIYAPDWLYAETTRHHARMVFAATPAERHWFQTIFHLENFGVFERSHFDQGETGHTLLAQARFAWQLLRTRPRGELGFWPWLRCRERGGAWLATLYRWYRLRPEVLRR
ncbi:MAG: HAD family hydrolase [Candidatus Sericytochromatia bacterium]|nr:HAD family hydrolase [Candidatus Sericytochromatia bacterium]